MRASAGPRALKFLASSKYSDRRRVNFERSPRLSFPDLQKLWLLVELFCYASTSSAGFETRFSPTIERKI